MDCMASMQDPDDSNTQVIIYLINNLFLNINMYSTSFSIA